MYYMYVLIFYFYTMNDDSTTGEMNEDIPEELVCEECGSLLEHNTHTEEYWGAQVLAGEWICKNCQ
jgi:hypothetical protein